MTADRNSSLTQRIKRQVRRALAPSAARITDKMPGIFKVLGIIALPFPGARVIHCRRNPVDTCLSCYFQDFAAAHHYGNDLETLGRYFLEYQRLMAHWESVSDIKMMSVRYEELVADPELCTRGLVEFCGLPWDDLCLRFFESERAARTASHDQVNQPIYTDSVARWRHYEPWIGPLLEVLGEAERQYADS